MAAPGHPTEDFMEVRLGAARLRILAILPVDDEDAHRLQPVHSASDRIEHSVHEVRALAGAVSLCQMDCFRE